MKREVPLTSSDKTWATAARSIRMDTFAAVLANGLGRIGNFLVAPAIATIIGITPTTDSFYLAWGLTIFVTEIFRLALEAAAVPVFVTDIMTDPEGAGQKLWGSIVGMVGVSCIVVAGVELVSLAPPGVTFLEQRLLLPPESLGLLRALLPFSVIQVANALLTSFLFARRNFATAGLLPLVQSSTVLISIVLAGPGGGMGGIVVAYYIGGVLQHGLGLIVLRSTGVRWSLIAITAMPLRRLSGMGPVLLAGTLLNINPIADKLTANAVLDPGSVTIFENAIRLFALPVGLLYGPVTNVLVSHWAAFVAQGRLEDATRHFHKSLRLGTVVLLPISAILLLVSAPLVTILYGRGAYDPRSVELTGEVFGSLVLGLPFFFVSGAASKYLYAMGRHGGAILVAIAALAVNVPLNFLLSGPLGLPGIALATAASYLASATAGLVLSKRATHYLTSHYPRN